ncbi:MAG: hypothetical protein QHJ81_00240 [Anaerolineae bacterium]|nr:hypothetical protein [Anaerolineae bacterium]
MSKRRQHPTDLRRYRRQTEQRLAIAVVLCLLFVGGGLVALIYGSGAAVMAVSCLLFGCALFALLWLILTFMGWWAGRE